MSNRILTGGDEQMRMMLHRKLSRGLRQRKPKREEAVEIQEKRFGYFPKVFRWHGKRYDVQVIERCWTVSKSAPRLYFRVRCREGIFDLYQDLHANTWHLIPLRAFTESPLA